MQSRRAFLQSAVLSSLGFTLGVACQSPAAAPPKAASPAAGKASTVNLGTAKGGIVYLSLVTAAAPYHVAVAKKYFADEGLQVEAIEIQMPADGIQALASDLHFTTPSMNPAVNAFNQGNTELRVLCPTFQTTSQYFCVKADSPIKQLTDIKGAKVAITFAGGSAHALAQDMVKEAGLPTDAVEYLPIAGGLAGINAALLTGQVNVAPITDPNLTKQLRSGEIRILWDPTKKTGFKYNEGILLSHTRVTQKDPELLKATIRAWNRGQELIKTSPKEAGEIWGKAVNAPADVASESLERVAPFLSMKTDWDSYVAVARHMERFNQLPPSGKMPWKTLFGDQSFLPPEFQVPMPDNLPYA